MMHGSVFATRSDRATRYGPKAGDGTKCGHEFGMGHEGVTPHARVASAAKTPLSQIAGRQEETYNGPF